MAISGHLEPSEAASSGLAISYAIELAGIVARPVDSLRRRRRRRQPSPCPSWTALR